MADKKPEEFQMAGGGDPANGPWHHYLEDQAEQDRRSRFIADEEMSCYAHERSWESGELTAVANQNKPLAELLVRAFYVGRASANRERPHARRIVSDALRACHLQYQRQAAKAFQTIMQSWGAE